MSTKYLLACTCGKTHEVDVAQAGRSLRCSCGESVEVPGLRGLRLLERVATPQETKRKNWTTGKGIVFAIGLIIFAIAAMGSLWAYADRQRMLAIKRPAEDVQLAVDLSQIERLAPDEAWEAWTKVREMDTLVPRATPVFVVARERAERLLTNLRVGSVFLGIGLAIMVLAVCWPARKRR